MAAEGRKLEREAKRHQRELEKQRKDLVKMQGIERAKFEVEEYENYIALIISLHKDCGPKWGWELVRDQPTPPEPQRERFIEHETIARRVFADYEPGRSDRLLRRADAKREVLRVAIESAVDDDTVQIQAETNKYIIPLYNKAMTVSAEVKKTVLEIQDNTALTGHDLWPFEPVDSTAGVAVLATVG